MQTGRRPGARAVPAAARWATLLAALLGGVLASSARAQEAERSPNLGWPADLDGNARAVCEDAERLWHQAEAEPTPANLQRAIERLQEASRVARRSPLPHYFLGIAYQYTEEYDQAERSLRRAIEMLPTFHEAEVELADNYTHREEYDAAARHYARAIELAPGYAEAWKRRAILLHVPQGEFEAAMADLDEALRLAPDDAEIPEIRSSVRRAVSGPDWPQRFTVENEHYRVVTNVSQDFAEFIAHRAELIHRLYESIFSENDAPDRLYPIIVYANEQEYHANGGPQGAGGHYSPIFRSLELFQYPNEADTLIVLHHEGFHQFLHTYLRDAPQWFDEGLGDYFGPSIYVHEGGVEMYRTRPNPWRLPLIQAAVRQGSYPPIERLMLMSQQEMYSQNPGLNYAMAWSLIYFCCERRDRNGDLVWFPALRQYFRELSHGRDGREAYARSFGRVDLDRFEQEWRRFILDLAG